VLFINVFENPHKYVVDIAENSLNRSSFQPNHLLQKESLVQQAVAQRRQLPKSRRQRTEYEKIQLEIQNIERIQTWRKTSKYSNKYRLRRKIH